MSNEGLLMRNVALLGKPETVYGQDATPDGANNAVLVSDVTLKPMEMQTVDRALIRPFLGSSEQLPTKIYNGLEFSCELAGSGTKGDAPPIGVFLRGCGFSETVTAGEKVVYAPVSTGFESLTFYANLDGVLHKSLGARGTCTFSLKNHDRPLAKFTFTGLFVPIQDAVMPVVDLSAWQKPLPVNVDNTPEFALHGYTSAGLDDLQIDMGHEVIFRSLVGKQQMVRITKRGAKGTVSMEAVKVGDKDWWTAISKAETGPLKMVHGLTEGNIVEIRSPGVQIHTPTYQDQEGVAMLSAQLAIPPSGTGNDELVLTFR